MIRIGFWEHICTRTIIGHAPRRYVRHKLIVLFAPWVYTINMAKEDSYATPGRVQKTQSC